ncbi:hypothetical protein QYF36_012332 [Acer negundo]|nr:hypothetical protein QYF36_012332 [Acer negundo]
MGLFLNSNFLKRDRAILKSEGGSEFGNQSRGVEKAVLVRWPALYCALSGAIVLVLALCCALLGAIVLVLLVLRNFGGCFE